MVPENRNGTLQFVQTKIRRALTNQLANILFLVAAEILSNLRATLYK
jgi:hypothetical protein